MTKLSRQNWIDFGLKALKDDGPSVLKAATLAKRLGVTRGSFYWYFENLSDFHDALLEQWQSSSAVIANEINAVSSPREKLLILMQAAQQSDMETERSFRAWARENQAVATRVDALDQMRITVVAQIISEDVAAKADAMIRAKFAYAAAIGLCDLGRDKVGLDAKELTGIVGMLLGRDIDE